MYQKKKKTYKDMKVFLKNHGNNESGSDNREYKSLAEVKIQRDLFQKDVLSL